MNIISAFEVYGLIIGGGMILCVVLAYLLIKKKGYNPDIVFDIAIVCIPMAIVGARFYYIIFDIIGGKGTFADWFSNLKWLGFKTNADGSRKFVGLEGLAIYGGLIFAVLGSFIVRAFNRKKDKKNQMTLYQMFDFFFILIILGQAIGRWGNFYNHEAYGNPISNDAFKMFPFAVLVNGVYYQATFFYESLWNIIGFGVLLWLYFGKRRSFDGFNFAVYLAWYGVGRAVIEGLRSDSLYLGSIRVSQLLSIILIMYAVFIVVYHIIRAKRDNKKIFIFVKQDMLSTDYYGYDKTIIYIRKQLKEQEKESGENTSLSITSIKDEELNGIGENTTPKDDE